MTNTYLNTEIYNYANGSTVNIILITRCNVVWKNHYIAPPLRHVNTTYKSDMPHGALKSASTSNLVSWNHNIVTKQRNARVASFLIAKKIITPNHFKQGIYKEKSIHHTFLDFSIEGAMLIEKYSSNVLVGHIWRKQLSFTEFNKCKSPFHRRWNMLNTRIILVTF